MAIVSCPFCGKKISNKASSCQHCGNVISDLDPQAVERFQRDNRLKKSQQINNLAMISIVMFLGSFLVFYFRHPEEGTWQQTLMYVVMGLGGLGYVAAKAMMVWFKRQ